MLNLKENSVWKGNEKFKEKCREFWAKILLEGLEPKQQLELAGLLENQRAANERITKNARFKRLSIPLVRRMFSPESGFVGFDLVNISTIMSPNSMVPVSLPNGIDYEPISAKSKIMKTHFHDGGIEHLEEEAALCQSLAVELGSEICREIVTDLYNHAGTQFEHQWRGPKALAEAFKLLANGAKNKTGHYPNWIITNQSLASALVSNFANQEQHDPPEGLDTAKCVHKWCTFGVEDPEFKATIYIDPKFPNAMVTGLYTVNGYQYCPYIALTDLEPHAPDTYQLVTRYGKRLLRNAANYYGRIIVGDYSPNEGTTGEQHGI
jgi:hypothetical protein